MRFRSLWAYVVFLGILACTQEVPARVGLDHFSLTQTAQLNPTVYVTEQADDALSLAAQDLQRLLSLRTGKEWGIEQGRPGMRVRAGVFLGLPPRVGGGKDEFAWRDDYLYEVQRHKLYLYGATPLASAFAGWSFCEQYLGVRWYMPGSLGEVLREDWQPKVPFGQQAFSPDYLSRWMHHSGSGEDYRQWSLRNRLVLHHSFNHNLHRIFTPKVLKEHPEFLPIQARQPLSPERMNNYAPQPRLVATGAVEVAAEAARAYFEKNPEAPSFSLSPNDTQEWSQDLATRRAIQPRSYFRNQPDYSPHFFDFVNGVAQTLEGTHSDRKLGALAYWTTQNVPPFELHRNVLPIVAVDRFQFYDEAFAAQERELLAQWGRTGVEYFGLWDYFYGALYLVPRVYFAMIPEHFRYAHAQGARVSFIELNAQWGYDAAKAWLTARLLWNTDADVDTLLAEFYDPFYGEASTPMQAFFAYAEKVWIRQTGSAVWNKYFREIEQAALFTPEDVAILEGHLQEAMATAQTETVRERLALTEAALATTRALVDYYAAWSIAAGAETQAALQALPDYWRSRAALEDNLRKRSDMAERIRRRYLEVSFLPDPTARVLTQALEQGLSLPEIPAHHGEMLSVLRSAKRSENRLYETDFGGGAPWVRAGGVSLAMLKRTPARGYWKWDVDDYEGGWVERLQEGEQARLRLERQINTKIYQWVPVKPGNWYQLAATFTGTVPLGNQVSLVALWVDQQGRVVGDVAFQEDRLAAGEYPQGQPLRIVGQAPEGAAFVRFTLSSKLQMDGESVFSDVAVRHFSQ